MIPMDPFDKIRSCFESPYAQAREWKKSGGKVVGYLSAAVPEEMIMAAGLFPVRLRGDINRETVLADKYMEFSFHPLVRSIYDMLLSGEFDFLDLLVIPHVNDSVFKLYYYLMENKRRGSSSRLPDLYLLDILYTKWRTTAQYNIRRIEDFLKRLEHLSGKVIGEAELSEAISLSNENKRLQRQIRRKRVNDPPLLWGADYLQISCTSMFMKKTDHSLILRELLQQDDIFSPKPSFRLMFSGDPLDSDGVYRIIEGCGVSIIHEDHDWGSMYADHVLSEKTHPLTAILETYHLNGMSPRAYPNPEGTRTTGERAVELGVDGVFFFFRGHDAAAWDYPQKKQALEARGIKTQAVQFSKDPIQQEHVIVEAIERLVHAD